MGLVTTAWLEQHRSDPDVRICDVRWFLGAPARGREAFDAGHIPGAVFVDLDTVLAAPDDGRAGRHPLPDPQVFANAMTSLGIGPDTHVVAYDDHGGAIAARLWWLLRASGHTRVSLLDGGIRAWREAGLPLVATADGARTDTHNAMPPVPATPFDTARHIDLQSLRLQLQDAAVTLVDARAPERYRGDVEPIDPRPGHIPGAINVPTASLLRDGCFLAPDALREVFLAAGITPDGPPLVASCGSGVTACHILFALDLCGLVPFERSLLYPGSYSEWSRRPELPVARSETGP
jgi:thiosulfate/3-mercaptopyruvate sulfurtransferase